MHLCMSDMYVGFELRTTTIASFADWEMSSTLHDGRVSQGVVKRLPGLEASVLYSVLEGPLEFDSAVHVCGI